jgi:ABC-type amino acid transport substrate-binding protein
MSFTDNEGKAAGYSVDICREIAQDVARSAGLPDMKVRYVPVTVDDRFEAVASGKVDIECGTSTISLSRMRDVDFTITVFLDGGGLLVRKDAAISSVPALVDETVAVIPGTTTERALRDALARRHIDAKVVPVESHAEGLAAVEYGSATAYASDQVLLIGLLLKNRKLEKLGIVPEQFSYEPYGFAVRRNDADFRLVANSALARLSRSGAMADIYERWFGTIGKPNPALVTMYLMNAIPE